MDGRYLNLSILPAFLNFFNGMVGYEAEVFTSWLDCPGFGFEFCSLKVLSSQPRIQI